MLPVQVWKMEGIFFFTVFFSQANLSSYQYNGLSLSLALASVQHLNQGFLNISKIMDFFENLIKSYGSSLMGKKCTCTYTRFSSSGNPSTG
jgi:hypothetical protein